MDSYPSWLNATLASDAAEGANVLAPGVIHPLRADWRVVGPAFVVHGSQDDNLAVNQAVALPPPAGCVLVVGGQAASRTATIGDLMALEIKHLGLLGLVTDGLVRDGQEIQQLGLPVWCRGITPIASAKRGPAVLGGMLAIGGALVRDGDLVIADGDGVVVWPQERVADLLTRAQAKLDADNARLTRLRGSAR